MIHNKIFDLNDLDIRRYNGSNQIAYIKLQIDDNLTVKDFRNKIGEYMETLSSIVDGSLD